MFIRTVILLVALNPSFSSSNGAFAQEGQLQGHNQKIAWFGTWKGGLAEAQRTGKPILLLSAAPQCHSVPG
ncbi:MAG: hypothetical protein VX438_08980, partial [Planctomycetota bacterium]|nr:hypothetical protein [Planctomycetota bacterium]